MSVDVIRSDVATKTFKANMAKFAEAQKAELDYSSQAAYDRSVADWYIDYLTEKHSKAEGQYDEYIEVINDIMFEIMGRLEWGEDNVICIPQNVDLECGAFDGLEQGKVTPIVIKVMHEVTSTKGNPFFDVEIDEERTPSLKCPEEVVDILEENGFSFDIQEFEIHVITPFLAYCQPLE